MDGEPLSRFVELLSLAPPRSRGRSFVGVLPLGAHIDWLPDWRKPFAIILAALHESRRRQVAREIQRYQHLPDGPRTKGSQSWR
jgi:hypothetical protein